MNTPTRLPRTLALLAALAASACTLGQDYRAPEPALPAVWSEPVVASAPSDDWWNAFGDPELSALVARALHSSPDLRAAVARLRVARAQRGIVDSALFPTVDAIASYSNSRLSENGLLKGLEPSVGSLPGAIAPGQQINLDQIGLDASWELDLFGLARREREEAQAEVESQLYGVDDALVALVAEVADGYVELCGLRARLALAHAHADSLGETLAVVRERHDAGVASDIELARAETALAEARARVPELEAAARVAQHRLETLVGVVPGALEDELAATHPVPDAPEALGAGIPSDLLRRRPDVRVAERKLAAATAASSAARADLLPHFSLTGTFGLQSQSLADLASWDSRFWTIGPSMRWPLLDFGRREHEIAVRDARVDEAQAEYDGTLLGALSDVEGALARLARAEVRRDALSDAERSSARAAALADELFRSGLGEFVDRLEAEREHDGAEDARVLARVAEARDAIALYRALGGGWETARAELAPAAGSETSE